GRIRRSRAGPSSIRDRPLSARRGMELRIAGGDGHPDRVAPFGPGTVVVADRVAAEQVLEHEPGVAGAFTDSAVDGEGIGRAHVAVDGVEFGAGPKAAVGAQGAGPGDVDGGRDMAAAQGAARGE